MAVAPGNPAAAPVPGGLVVAGRVDVVLFDEESGRWLTLLHPMAERRVVTELVSLPASALQAA